MKIKPDREFYIDEDRVLPRPGFGDKPVTDLTVALDNSIAKWIFIRDHADERPHDGGQLSCALCAMFYRYDCVGCPIYNHMGEKYCEGTPYDDYHFAHYFGDESISRLKEIAQTEINLLLRLRSLWVPETDEEQVNA